MIEDTLQCVAEDLTKAPPPGLRDRILDSVTPEKPEASEEEAGVPEKAVARKTKLIHYWQYGVAATFTLKLVFMAIAANFWIKWQNTEQQLSAMQTQYNRLEQSSQQATQALTALSDPAFQTLVLRGQGAEADTRVLAYWNEETQELLVNTAPLSPSSENQQYQVWASVDGKPISIGVFGVDASSTLPQIRSFEGVAGLAGVSISLEPAGGSTSPGQTPLYSSQDEASPEE